MRWLVTFAVVFSLMSPTAALGYSFGDWASDDGYLPGAVMPWVVYTQFSSPVSALRAWAASSTLDPKKTLSSFTVT